MKMSIPSVLIVSAAVLLLLLGVLALFWTRSLGGTKKVESVFQNDGNKTIYDFTMKNIDGEDVPLKNYAGKVLLVVNVASECGFTPQYKDLQTLYEKEHDKGFELLGFPANNFGAQEPGTDAEIKKFCTEKFHVTFPMFSKISVKGNDMHPFYKYLTSKAGNGVMDSEVRWNFQKYLIDKNGILHQVFYSKVNPMNKQITDAIEELLNAK